MNYSVFDVENLLVIKLGEDKLVLSALQGRRILCQDEIKSIYGNPPLFPYVNFPVITDMTGLRKFWTFSTYFDSCKVPLVLMGVEMILSGKVDKTCEDLMHDIRKGIFR